METFIAICVGVVFAIIARSIGLKSSQIEWWVFSIACVVVVTAALEAVGVY